MKIVLVEDDTFFQQFYAFKLQSSGFEVTIGVNGKDGMEKIQLVRPDLILLDIIMPVMNGFEVLAALQKDPNLSRIPVLVFSTLGQEQDREKAMQLGAKGYVNKSFFDFDTLLAKIKEIQHM